MEWQSNARGGGGEKLEWRMRGRTWRSRKSDSVAIRTRSLLRQKTKMQSYTVIIKCH
jgi:hypothetical protein